MSFTANYPANGLSSGTALQNVNLTEVGGAPISLGQTVSADSLPVVLASDQSPIPTSAPVNANGSFLQAAISVASSITAPANAVGFLLEADSANTDFMRWCDSNSTASATNGMKLEPGRDTGFIPMKHNLSICPNSSTQTYTIQWILSS